MELIRYRKTLDVHKNGIQFMLQGFETADKLSRVIEISLMASGDAIDFPLENVEALMYVTTPNATEPSINKCTIKDNKVVYDVLPIVEEGITTMQLKIISTGTDGARGVLASPKFSVEVTKSDADDESAIQTTTFTSLEDAVAKAKAVYDARLLRIELANDCMFRAYYAGASEDHDVIYETDILKKLFNNGNVLLSESYAHGGTGVRAGEDTDNSKYYSTVAHSEALNAKEMVEDGKEILEETKLHGVYTAFSVDFESGEVEYVSPSFTFKINTDSGELDAIGQAYSFDDEVGRVVNEWLAKNGADIPKIKEDIIKNSEDLSKLNEDLNQHKEDFESHKADFESHKEDFESHKTEFEEHKDAFEEHKAEINPIEKGGTGASTLEEARVNLGIAQEPLEVKIIASEGPSSVVGLYTNIEYYTETTFAEITSAVESGRRVFARVYKADGTRAWECEFPLFEKSSNTCLFFGAWYGGMHNDDVRDYQYCFKVKSDSSVVLYTKQSSSSGGWSEA